MSYNYGDSGGLVVVPCRPEHARYIDVWRNLSDLDLPSNSKIKPYPGFFPHQNRTLGVKEGLRDGANWFFFVDDDQLLPHDALTKLLEHKMQIVSCNLINKHPPFIPYMYQVVTEDGLHMEEVLPNKAELIEVKACGLGGVLVRPSVFKVIPEPWFDVDQFTKTDDLYFCKRAREYGNPIMMDLTVISGHIGLYSVWPTWDGKEWRPAIVIDGHTTIVLAPYVPDPVTEEFKRKYQELQEVNKK